MNYISSKGQQSPKIKSEVSEQLTNSDLSDIKSRESLKKAIKEKKIPVDRPLFNINYEKELVYLQIELVKLQQWIVKNNKRVAVLLEGRDAAGKGGTIRRFREHLNPRSMRVVALDKPTKVEKGQWYFTRYVKHLPNPGEIVFFDRSWYNRAVVEPVMGFCGQSDYKKFMQQVPEFEHMLYEDGVDIIKLWFSVSKDEQSRRFDSRATDPLKQWKMSPVDMKAQELWEKFTHYKEEMFSKTHTSFSPWIIVKANKKKTARLESIRYVLSCFDYDDKDDTMTRLFADPNIVERFHRSIHRID